MNSSVPTVNYIVYYRNTLYLTLIVITYPRHILHPKFVLMLKVTFYFRGDSKKKIILQIQSDLYI